MAGVGFQLRRLLQRRSVTSLGMCFVSASLLSAGPWMITIVGMALLLLWITPLIGTTSAQLLVSTVIYANCVSLIISGPAVMLSIRYAADQIHLRRFDRIRGGVHAALAVTATLASVLLLFLVGWDSWVDPRGQERAYRVTAGFLVLCLSLVWVMFGTVTYVRWYRSVVVAFIISALTSLGGALWFSRISGAVGALGGYTLGFAVLLGGLYFLWQRRYHRGPALDADVFRTFLGWLPIAGVGLLCPLAIWMDKITLWALRGDPVGQTPLRSLAHYDVLTFLAYLSMVPVMGYFLVRVETNFFERYRRYLAKLRKGTLAEIDRSDRDLRDSVHRGLGRMACYQLVITSCLMLLAGPILDLFGLTAWPSSVFRLLLLASGFQVLLLTIVILLLYFDLQWDALVLCAVFCLSNALFTAWSMAWPPYWLGSGYVLSTGLSLVLGLGVLELRLRRITFLIFSRVPLVSS